MDGIFDVKTFTVPRVHRWDEVRPRPGLIIGLIHVGTNIGVFAMWDLDPNMEQPYILKVYIPVDTDFKGWGGRWWPLDSIIRQFPDSEIARHYEGFYQHPENYIWIYPNLERFLTEDWFKEIADATPDFEWEGGYQCS